MQSKTSLRKYVIQLFLLALLLTAAGYGIFWFLVPASYFPFFPAVPFFILAITLAVHIYLVRAGEQDPRKFMAKYLGAMGLKIFIYILFLLLCLALATEHAVAFLVSFLVCYAVFTLVEVIVLLKILKRPGS